MIGAFFRSNRPAVLLATPLVVLALFGPMATGQGTAPPELMPLAAMVDSLIGGLPVVQHIVALVLVLLIAVQLALLVNAVEIMDRTNHLSALLFPLLLALLGGRIEWHPALLGMPFVLLAMRIAWSLDNTGPALGALFNAGLLIGMAALCYLPFAFLLAVLWATVSLVRPFNGREHLLPLVGVALAFYLAWGVLHLLALTPWHPLHSILAGTDLLTWGVVRAVAFWTTACLLLMALSAFASTYARAVMRGKNLRSSFLAFLFACLVLCGLLHMINGGFPAALLATPLAVLCGYALVSPKRPWMGELVLWVLVPLVLWAQWAA